MLQTSGHFQSMQDEDEAPAHGGVHLNDCRFAIHTSVNHQLTQDEDEALALEACEFWPAFADSALDPALLAPHLPQLVPLLLRNMVYGEFDEEVVDTEAAEAAGPGAPDADADVRPFHHR